MTSYTVVKSLIFNKIHIFESQKPHFPQIHSFLKKNHLVKISFSQNSHFENIIFDKIHNSKDGIKSDFVPDPGVFLWNYYAEKTELCNNAVKALTIFLCPTINGSTFEAISHLGSRHHLNGVVLVTSQSLQSELLVWRSNLQSLSFFCKVHRICSKGRVHF